MSIVNMRKLHTIMPQESKGKVLREFTRMGCIEIKNADIDEQYIESGALKTYNPDYEARDKQRVFSKSLEILKKYAFVKKPFFEPLKSLEENEFYDDEKIAAALTSAEEIIDLKKSYDQVQNEITQLNSKIEYIKPWVKTSVPLDYSEKDVTVIFGICPSSTNIDDLADRVENEIPLSLVEFVGSDEDRHYFLTLFHNSVKDELVEILKEYSFSRANFNDEHGMAADCLKVHEESLNTQKSKDAEILRQFEVLQKNQDDIEQAYDYVSLELKQDMLSTNMMKTKNTVYLEAWVPETEADKVSSILTDMGCTAEYSEPKEDEDVPVYTKNSKFVSPFSAITELYGTPSRSGIVDPNPMVAIFFTIFFGMMLGDAMYGAILAIACFVVLRKKRPTGTFKKFMTLAATVGLSAVVFGILMSSWFGDFPTVLGKMIGVDIKIPALLFEPLEEPMILLGIALGIGIINIFVGMWLEAWRLIKTGHVMDAIFDVFFWYMILGGLVIALVGGLLGLYGLAPGLIIAGIGAIGVLFTGGRKSKNIFGKIVGGFGSLYDITSYFSDILSYSRLMALGLATGVVAQVMNAMGSLAGNGVFGWILFIVVFLIGQTFNLFIGLLGAFVHSCRLIYVEFFGKFFVAGGRAFSPLYYDTQYIHVIKEGE